MIRNWKGRNDEQLLSVTGILLSSDLDASLPVVYSRQIVYRLIFLVLISPPLTIHDDSTFSSRLHPLLDTLFQILCKMSTKLLIQYFPLYYFKPIAVETLGALGECALCNGLFPKPWSANFCGYCMGSRGHPSSSSKDSALPSRAWGMLHT